MFEEQMSELAIEKAKLTLKLIESKRKNKFLSELLLLSCDNDREKYVEILKQAEEELCKQENV